MVLRWTFARSTWKPKHHAAVLGEGKKRHIHYPRTAEHAVPIELLSPRHFLHKNLHDHRIGRSRSDLWLVLASCQLRWSNIKIFHSHGVSHLVSRCLGN